MHNAHTAIHLNMYARHKDTLVIYFIHDTVLRAAVFQKKYDNLQLGVYCLMEDIPNRVPWENSSLWMRLLTGINLSILPTKRRTRFSGEKLTQTAFIIASTNTDHLGRWNEEFPHKCDWFNGNWNRNVRCDDWRHIIVHRFLVLAQIVVHFGHRTRSGDPYTEDNHILLTQIIITEHGKHLKKNG